MNAQTHSSLSAFFSPLLHAQKGETLTYAEEKELSAEIDRRLGLRHESDRTNGTAETWSHLSPQIYQTPYPELYRMIEDTDPERKVGTWIDLGAAYGRLGLLLRALRPESKFTGIEIDEKRVNEAKRIFLEMGIPEESIQQGDCERDPLPLGDVYLIYDFGHRRAVESALEKLRMHARSHPLRVIGRGRRVRDLIEKSHPWLGSVFKPRHTTHYSIYRTYAEGGPQKEE